MIFGNITNTDLLICGIDFIVYFLFFFFVMQIKRELEKIEEEEMLKILKKKYEKGDK